MKISIDLDGVLCDFTHAACKVISQKWPGRIPDGYSPPDWGYSDNMSKSDWDEVWKRILSTPAFWSNIRGYHENVIELRKWLNNNPNSEVYYITSRVDTIGSPALVQSAYWLKDEGLLRLNTQVIVAKLPSKKRAIMDAIGIEYCIDDKPSTVQHCVRSGRRSFIHDRSWNRGEDFGIYRVHSIKEFLDAVDLGENCRKFDASLCRA